jgi:Cu2+-exporting ATPase
LLVSRIGVQRASVSYAARNLLWVFIYNLIAIPVAAGILYPFTGFLLNPMVGGAAMSLTSVSVVAIRSL